MLLRFGFVGVFTTYCPTLIFLYVARRISKDRFDLAVGLYLSGAPGWEASLAADMSEATLFKELKERGIAGRKRVQHVKTVVPPEDPQKEDKERICRLFGDGVVLWKISIISGYGLTACRKVLKEAGVYPVPVPVSIPREFKCKQCEIVRPIEDFVFCLEKPWSGREKTCRECRKKRKREFNHKNKEKIYQEFKKLRMKKLGVINDLKRAGCCDCGQVYEPYCLDFDHVSGDKVASVAQLLARCASLKAILEEIKKTELVCILCHRNRTHRRADERRGKKKRRVSEQRKFVNKLKEAPCVDCGKTFNPWQMDFDHRKKEEKIAPVSCFVSQGKTKGLLEEIAKCDLVCCLCHRRRTYQRRQLDRQFDGAGPF